MKKLGFGWNVGTSPQRISVSGASAVMRFLHTSYPYPYAILSVSITHQSFLHTWVFMRILME